MALKWTTEKAYHPWPFTPVCTQCRHFDCLAIYENCKFQAPFYIKKKVAPEKVVSLRKTGLEALYSAACFAHNSSTLGRMEPVQDSGVYSAHGQGSKHSVSSSTASAMSQMHNLQIQKPWTYSPSPASNGSGCPLKSEKRSDISPTKHASVYTQDSNQWQRWGFLNIHGNLMKGSSSVPNWWKRHKV